VHRSHMSTYEARAWDALQSYWERRRARQLRRVIPAGVRERAGKGLARVADWAGDVAADVVDHLPEQVVEVMDAATLKIARWTEASILSLLSTITEICQALMSEERVLQAMREDGQEVKALDEIRGLDMRHCDSLNRGLSWKLRGFGVLEGGALGAVATLSGPAMLGTLAADVLVIHAVTTATVTRVAHSYGIDATSLDEREFIQTLVNRSLAAQASKVSPITQVGKAGAKIRGRVRWSRKLREDKLIAAVERLLQTINVKPVPVAQVAKAVPAINVLIAAGFNSHLLGDVATFAQQRCRTRFLCEKYELPIPAALRDEDAAA